MGPQLERKWPPRWTTNHNTITTGALTPETPFLVPVIIPPHPDFQALRHAIFIAILNTEATPTFMFLPVWGQHMITNPYSKLITAYPYLCCELGTIACTNLCYNNPQSCPNQEIPLSRRTWDLQIIAVTGTVWDTAARVHLYKHNPAWLQGLASA
eukprot:1141688-Pelagomonas_calceolata.AAC.2